LCGELSQPSVIGVRSLFVVPLAVQAPTALERKPRSSHRLVSGGDRLGEVVGRFGETRGRLRDAQFGEQVDPHRVVGRFLERAPEILHGGTGHRAGPRLARRRAQPLDHPWISASMAQEQMGCNSLGRRALGLQ
jgi:hypothetical protein